MTLHLPVLNIVTKVWNFYFSFFSAFTYIGFNIVISIFHHRNHRRRAKKKREISSKRQTIWHTRTQYTHGISLYPWKHLNFCLKNYKTWSLDNLRAGVWVRLCEILQQLSGRVSEYKHLIPIFFPSTRSYSYSLHWNVFLIHSSFQFHNIFFPFSLIKWSAFCLIEWIWMNGWNMETCYTSILFSVPSYFATK